MDNKVPPRDYAGRFWVDSLVHDADTLRFIVKLFGQDKVALSSDYPFPLGEDRPGTLIDSLTELSLDTREQLWKNALAWLGRARRIRAATTHLFQAPRTSRRADRADTLCAPPSATRSTSRRGRMASRWCTWLATRRAQPKNAARYVQEELETGPGSASRGHHHGQHPWLHYHELVTAQAARMVGAKPQEVVVMNTLTVNLHLMMVSFCRPTNASRFWWRGGRSHARMACRWRPGRASTGMTRVKRPSWSWGLARVRDTAHRGRPRHIPRPARARGRCGDAGQRELPHGPGVRHPGDYEDGARQGCFVGFDLAHGATSRLALHDGPDFMMWCSYKYLNGGELAGRGVRAPRRHARSKDIPRWWVGARQGHALPDGADVRPAAGRGGWRLSNPPILQLAALRASVQLFDQAGMEALRAKARTHRLRSSCWRSCLRASCASSWGREAAGRAAVAAVQERGAGMLKRLSDRHHLRLPQAGHHPRGARAAYCSFTDVYRFVRTLEAHARD